MTAVESKLRPRVEVVFRFDGRVVIDYIDEAAVEILKAAVGAACMGGIAQSDAVRLLEEAKRLVAGVRDEDV